MVGGFHGLRSDPTLTIPVASDPVTNLLTQIGSAGIVDNGFYRNLSEAVANPNFRVTREHLAIVANYTDPKRVEGVIGSLISGDLWNTTGSPYERIQEIRGLLNGLSGQGLNLINESLARAESKTPEGKEKIKAARIEEIARTGVIKTDHFTLSKGPNGDLVLTDNATGQPTSIREVQLKAHEQVRERRSGFGPNLLKTDIAGIQTALGDMAATGRGSFSAADLTNFNRQAELGTGDFKVKYPVPLPAVRN